MNRTPLRILSRITLFVAGLFAWSGCATAKNNGLAPFTVTQRSFTSGGVKILVDVYTPVVDASLCEARGKTSLAREPSFVSHRSRASRSEASRGRRPPILVLHGAGGMLFDGPEMSRVARELATAGYEVYQIHYFDRTHTWFARQAVLLRFFPTWLETVHDAVEWVRSLHPESQPVGIFGYSLGAFAAVEEARRNPAIGAVVEQAGGFWHGHPEGPTRQPLPPMLLIHGRDDQRVPFAKYTEPLLVFLRVHRDPFESHFFPGEGHQFTAAAGAKVRAQAVKFFRQELPARPK